MDMKTSKEIVFKEIKGEEAVSKKKTAKKIILAVAAFLVIVLVAVYARFAYYYMHTIFPGTIINGIDCSEMSVEQAELRIKEKVEDYSLNISFRDGSTNVIHGSDIDYKYISSGEIQQILDKQDVWKWIVHVFSRKEYEVKETIQFEESLLMGEVYNLESVSTKTQIEPVDAYITYDKYSFVIIPEEEGNLIRQTDLLDAVKEAVSASQTELNVAELDIYEKPAIRSDAVSLIKECEQLNQLAKVSITYMLPEGEKILDGNEVRTWLHTDEDGNYTITEKELNAKVTEFVSTMSAEVNTVGIERSFNATIQGERKVSGGSYGYKINQKSETKRILEDIANHAVTIREPEYISKEVTSEAEGLGDTYIEIDLSNQHLWYYIKGELYLESDLVSGTYTNPGRITPRGIYLLSYKTRNAVLRGQKKEDGTYEYESPVSYWMPFNGGIGLHDASWRGSFGGNIYKYNGSHGCINLPKKNAKLIYEKIDQKTPIILYY